MSNRWKRSKEPELTLCQNLYSAYQALSANSNGSRHAFLQVLQAGSGELLLVPECAVRVILLPLL